MTTKAQQFAKLLNMGFQVVHNEPHEDNFILLPSQVIDSYLLFDIEGDKILCDICNHQMYYNSGDTTCENNKCGDTRYEKLFGKNKK